MSEAEQQRLREERQEQVRQEQAVKEQARIRVPESERRRVREEREERERQHMKEREEEMEEYRAWKEQQKPEPNPEMWKILAMQESARLQERERLREYDEREHDEDEGDVEDKEEDLMDMPLCNMNDLQIENYVKRIGRCPRDECDEWTMLYNGGDILRYSYCKFIQWGIEDQLVSNITITRAVFNEITFTNYVFDNVTFDECVFKDIILNNTTFKNSKFIECELDSSMVPDKSCKIINNFDSDDHIHITYY
jgi:hypothetical protein